MIDYITYFWWHIIVAITGYCTREIRPKPLNEDVPHGIEL